MPLLKYYDTVTSQWVPILTGAKGDTGDTGPTGPEGPAGLGSVAVTSPITNSGTSTSAVVGLDYSALQYGRNVIINGAFEINQRAYVSGTNLASGVYGFDRWKSSFTNTSLTFTSAPQGQLVTINSGGSIEQIIERQNLPAGTYTLSWNGTATGRVYNTGATAPAYASSPITVTIDGTQNVEVEFTATGGTRTLGQVQLEAGSRATPFKRNGSSVQAEIASCQRYYYTWQSSSATMGMTIGTAWYSNPFSFPVEMRISPIATINVSPTVLYGNGTSYTVTSFTAGTSSGTEFGKRTWQFYANLASSPGNYNWPLCTFNTHGANFNAEL